MKSYGFKEAVEILKGEAMSITEREAIEELHKIRPIGSIIPQKRAEAIDMAINALEEIEQYKGTVEELKLAKEKQIAKKPKTDDRYVMYICPCCNDFIKVSHNYCQNCGQKLDWSDKE